MGFPVSEAELRAAVIAEARSWLKTPFHHKAKLKGLKGGVDCIGVMWDSGEKGEAMDALTDEDLATFWDFYSRRPQPKVMREVLERFLRPITKQEAKPGDVVWMHWGNQIPVHFAVIGDPESRPTLIHAVLDYCVVEQGFRGILVRRAHSYWRYPRIAEAML